MLIIGEAHCEKRKNQNESRHKKCLENRCKLIDFHLELLLIFASLGMTLTKLVRCGPNSFTDHQTPTETVVIHEHEFTTAKRRGSPHAKCKIMASRPIL